jgi:hypothetical protein
LRIRKDEKKEKEYLEGDEGRIEENTKTKRRQKVRVKPSPCLTKYHAMKTLGSGGTAPRILNLCTRQKWLVSFTPGSFTLRGKNPRYPLDRRLGRPQSQSGRGGEEKISLPLPGFEPLSYSP